MRSNKRVSTSKCLPGLKYQQIPARHSRTASGKIRTYKASDVLQPKKKARKLTMQIRDAEPEGVLNHRSGALRLEVLEPQIARLL